MRRILIFLFSRLGFIRLFQFFNRNKIVILLIHGVIDEKDDSLFWKPLLPRLDQKRFEKYMCILSKYYNFISLPDAIEMLAGRKPIKPYSMVLTFDDGYQNNLTHAVPVLSRFNAPATIFVSTGYVNNPRPYWWDRLDYVLQHAEIDGRDVKIGSVTTRLNKSNRKMLLNSYHTVNHEHMSDMEFVSEYDNLSAQLEQESGYSLSEIQPKDKWSVVLTWEQLINNCFSDITIGSHTVDHINLNYVDKQVAYQQLMDSKLDIEKKLKKECFCISYPYGCFNDEVADTAKRCGYVCGLSAKEGLNQQGDDLMKLRRIDLPVDDENMNFLIHVSGLSAAKDKIKLKYLNFINKF